MASAPRAFSGLNGMEVKKAILKQIERHLDADTRFSQHLAYGRIEWRWKLATDCYPKEVGGINLELSGKIFAPKMENPADEVPTLDIPDRIDLSGGTVVAAPVAGISADQARREAGLPIPSSRTVAGPENSRIHVDAPEVPYPKRETTEEGDTESPVTVQSAKPVAKSVSILTRANPKGMSVPEHPGAAPTVEDADKIIEEGLRDGTLEERSE